MADNQQQLFRQPHEAGDEQRRIGAAVVGAMQIWESFASCVTKSTSPETIRQIANRVTDQLNQLENQLGQSGQSGQYGGQQQLGGSNR